MSDEHPLDRLFRKGLVLDAEGVWRELEYGTALGNNTGSDRGNAIFRQMQSQANAPNPEDVQGYEARMATEDGRTVRDELARMAEEGRINDDDRRLLETNHRVFNENADYVYQRLIEAEQDRPRLERLAALREALREEDEATGGHSTTRRMEILQAIAAVQTAR
jgi:hypothetical protein